MTKPTFDTHDPNNFIEFTLFRNYNLKPIVNEIIKKRQSQKNHDPFVYFDNNEIVRIIKSKYTNRQIKDLKRKHPEYMSCVKCLGIITDWMNNKEVISYQDNGLKDRMDGIYDKLKNFNTNNIFKLPYKQFVLKYTHINNNNTQVQYEAFIGFKYNYQYRKEGDIRSYGNFKDFDGYCLTIMNTGFYQMYPIVTFDIPLIEPNFFNNLEHTFDDIDCRYEKNSIICKSFTLLLLSYCNALIEIVNGNIANHNISINNKNEPSNHTKDEIQPWDVTSRKGEPIRPKEITKTTTIDDDEDYEFVIDPKTYRDYPETHQPPRPHMRRGHAHNYWCGSGENKHLEERWIKPIEVNHVDRIGPDQMPVVFHDTTDK